MPDLHEVGPAGLDDLDSEDATLVALARSAQARTGAVAAAAVREDTGRSYVAAAVELAALRLSALDAAVAAAVSSGARVLEAAALVTEGAVPTAGELAALVELSRPGTRLIVAGPDGVVRALLRLGE